MMIRLHKNATTTPAIRAYIQSSPLPVAVLANELGVSEDTIHRLKGRDSVEDRSHTAHRLQTTLTPAQELLVVELRKTLLLSLDDLLVVTREFIHPNVSRSGLSRCLQRHGVGRLKDLQPAAGKPAHKPFMAQEPGYFHVDKRLSQMPDEAHRRYRHHRPRNPLGLHSGQIPQNRRGGLPESGASGLPDSDHEASPITARNLRIGCLARRTGRPRASTSSKSCVRPWVSSIA